jgi:hypothetical protein
LFVTTLSLSYEGSAVGFFAAKAALESVGLDVEYSPLREGQSADGSQVFMVAVIVQSDVAVDGLRAAVRTVQNELRDRRDVLHVADDEESAEPGIAGMPATARRGTAIRFCGVVAQPPLTREGGAD